VAWSLIEERLLRLLISLFSSFQSTCHELTLFHSSGSSVSTYTILPTGGLKLLQSFTFALTSPGTVPSRQDAPHPHEAILDPTDSFIVVPDLGADLLRVFSIDPITSLLTESTSKQITPGAGPRHGAFLVTAEGTWFFLVDEIDNQVRSFKTTYSPGSLTFDEVFEASTYGNVTIPTAFASEVIVSVSPSFPFSPLQRYSLTSQK